MGSYHTPDQSPPHVTGHCELLLLLLLLLLGFTGRAQTRANAETNSPVVVVWCREETCWVRCTARRTQASEPTLTAFLRSAGGGACRVNSSWYFVLHKMTDCCCCCCCSCWWCCCSAAAAVVYGLRIHREVRAARASLGTQTRASRMMQWPRRDRCAPR